jgi:hypothetical protein
MEIDRVHAAIYGNLQNGAKKSWIITMSKNFQVIPGDLSAAGRQNLTVRGMGRRSSKIKKAFLGCVDLEVKIDGSVNTYAETNTDRIRVTEVGEDNSVIYAVDEGYKGKKEPDFIGTYSFEEGVRRSRKEEKEHEKAALSEENRRKYKEEKKSRNIMYHLVNVTKHNVSDEY